MAEETYQELKTPSPEADLSLEPKFPDKLHVGNLIRRVWSSLFGLCNGTLKRLVCDTTGRLRVSPVDYPWTYKAGTTSQVSCNTGAYTSIITGMGTTYKKVEICFDGNDTGRILLQIGSVAVIVSVSQYTTFLQFEGRIADVKGQADNTTLRATALAHERVA